MVTSALNCGRISENGKGTREMFEMNVTKLDSTSPGYQLDGGLERRKKSKIINYDSKS